MNQINEKVNKKFILMQIILAFLWVTNSAIGMDRDELTILHHVNPRVMGMQDRAPGPESWKDNFGRTAPPRVRKAADQLWGAVKIEGKASFDAKWGVQKKAPCGLIRGCLCCFSCGCSECMYSCCDTYDEFGWRVGSGDAKTERLIFTQRTKEAMEALDFFNECVNASVLKPEQYSGDANVCRLGAWIEDDSLRINYSIGFALVGGYRDLSLIPKSTMAFVNAHGGWVTDDGKANIYVIVEK